MNDGNNETDYAFFTGSALWDSLVTIFAIIGVMCVMVIAVIVSSIPQVRRVLYGAEGARIWQQRSGMQGSRRADDL